MLTTLQSLCTATELQNQTSFPQAIKYLVLTNYLRTHPVTYLHIRSVPSIINNQYIFASHPTHPIISIQTTRSSLSLEQVTRKAEKRSGRNLASGILRQS